MSVIDFVVWLIALLWGATIPFGKFGFNSGLHDDLWVVFTKIFRSTDAAHVWGSCGWEMPGCEMRVFQVREDGSKTECPPAKDLFNATEEEQGASTSCVRRRACLSVFVLGFKV